MRTKQILLTIFMALILLSFIQCTKDNGTATLNVKASMTKLVQLNGTIALAPGELVIESAIIQIENIAIDDNTGECDNDAFKAANNKEDLDSIEDQSGEQSEKDDKFEKNDKETDGDDQILVGPYSLNITSGLASIGDVTVKPGTYKEVTFSFVDGSSNGVNSIVITGKYIAANGVETPFNLSYNSSNALQLPLADSGLVIVNGSTVSLSIVFDVESWLNTLDFSMAEISNGIIDISSSKNISLYNAFIVAIDENVDVEE